MSRIIKKEPNGPVQLDTDGTPVFICGCGLTRNENGTCDGSHHKTKDEEEGKTYVYDENLDRKEVCPKCGKDDCACDDNKSCGCGGNCACGN